ncbi:MAG: pyridoxal phosphate-dependent aminotransferase [Gemmatimonadetes bacterium]|nr:pyridoxal phosphate-dependent aminotransferase [Gemmatimonadota bacterium]
MTSSSDSVFVRSRNIRQLQPSATIAVTQEAARRRAVGEDIIDLSAGEPDFDTPSVIADGAIRAIQDGKTHYPPNAGILDLRAAAASHLSVLSGGRPVNADNIVVSTGAKQSLFNACFTLFGPHDSVLIPTPCWVSYPQMIHLARANPVMVAGDPEFSLKVSVEDLEEASDANTRGLMLCTPNNPTGAVYTKSELRAITEWASRRKIWVISDEIYRRIHYAPGPAPSVLDLPDELLSRVVVIYGASKAYAMTGWRIGLTLAPVEVSQAIAALQSHVTSGANHPAQYAAAVAFSDERVEGEVQNMVQQFQRRREIVVEHFREHLPGFEFVEPLGAFYLFFRVDACFGGDVNDAVTFCQRLIADGGVALVPGEAFGDDRWVRLSFAASEQQIREALKRLVLFINNLRGAKAGERAGVARQ